MRSILFSLSLSLFSLVLASVLNAGDAFPADQLQKDWMQQDSGSCDVSSCFTSQENAALERKMVENVLAELVGCGDALVEEFRETMTKLQGVPGSDLRWKSLYLNACTVRRAERLKNLTAHTNSVLFLKHCLIAAPGNISSNHHPSDFRPRDGKYPEVRHLTWKPGSQLCRLTVAPDGSVKCETLLETAEGFIRDPALSFDGKTLVFAMRDSFRNDDFDLFLMDLATGSRTQITHKLSRGGEDFPTNNLYPCFLPNGRILFQSTRCGQLDPCGWDQTGTFYTMKADGTDIQRITYDQVTTMSPTVLDDGRVLYTRWEYNDRTPIYVQPLFTMNEDGTAQTEFYGNNSWFPTSILHARGIPGSHKVMAIASGHHVLQKGKLILIDRSKGTQEESGIEFLAGSAPDGTPGRKLASDCPMEKHKGGHLDGFGQAGPQFAHPFPFSETSFLVSFTPDGYQGFGVWGANVVPYKLGQPFGLYWMDDQGRRELLAFDPAQCCVEAIPVQTRVTPPSRASMVDESQNSGTFYVQNIYLGPGLAGIEPGTVKKLRVLGLQYRAAWVGSNRNDGPGGDSCAQCPIGGDNASWDVKHVLGEVDVEADGSAYFEVPAHQPVFFQCIDEKGHCVQTMRSWTLLLPGERFACLGCHEDKMQVGLASQPQSTIAMGKPAQKLQPFAGVMHPFVKRIQEENQGLRDSVENFLGINMTDSWDENHEIAGFSFPQRVQPIWDRHCVKCHAADAKASEGTGVKPSAFLLTSKPVHDPRAMRFFTESYVSLTNHGRLSPLVKWLEAETVPPMLKPYEYGSGNSQLVNYLEPSHYGVNLTQEEKNVISCWIDLGVPFCGSYTESMAWPEDQKKIYEHYQQKRLIYAEEELKEPIQ